MFDDSQYLDISVDCVIFGFDDFDNSLKVLLIEQEKISNEEPFKALPGDLVFKEEDFDSAASRVLEELTGLKGFFLKQFYAFGNPERVRQTKDQTWLHKYRKHPEQRIITIGYYSIIRMEDYNLIPSSFASKAEWISITDIPDLAFDHNEILEMALDHLRSDTINNNISFELLPKKFTLAQLQNLHELILDKELDKRNFRKYVKKMDELIPLNEKQKGVYHKPAQLYKFEKILENKN